MDINSRDPDGYTPGDVIERIIRTVNEGTYTWAKPINRLFIISLHEYGLF